VQLNEKSSSGNSSSSSITVNWNTSLFKGKTDSALAYCLADSDSEYLVLELVEIGYTHFTFA